MNKLKKDDYVLHLWWNKLKEKIINLKYLVLPIIYIIIIIMVVPKPKVMVNKVEIEKPDSYIEVKVETKKKEKTETKIDKEKYILEKYNLTNEQFNILVAVVLTEAESNSYEDAYAVINTIYNRTHSKSWVRSVSNRFGKGKGSSLYYQVIHPNQFTVYQSGSYKRNLNNRKSVGYNAIIDFLYSEKIMHNYLSFRSHSSKVSNYEMFSERGNKYFNELKSESRI